MSAEARYEDPGWDEPAADSATVVDGDGQGEVEPDNEKFSLWVMGWLFPRIGRPMKSGSTWCPQWWRHREANARLYALWEAWMAAKGEGGAAMSYWWTVHFDSHWHVLTSDQGPFAACREAHSDRNEHLEVEVPPAEWEYPGTGDL